MTATNDYGDNNARKKQQQPTTQRRLSCRPVRRSAVLHVMGSVPQPAGFVLLVSGLQVGGKHDPLLVSLLVDFVAGYLGSAEDQESTSAR